MPRNVEAPAQPGQELEGLKAMALFAIDSKLKRLEGLGAGTRQHRKSKDAAQAPGVPVTDTIHDLGIVAAAGT